MRYFGEGFGESVGRLLLEKMARFREKQGFDALSLMLLVHRLIGPLSKQKKGPSDQKV
jgi:hypothetical protein